MKIEKVVTFTKEEIESLHDAYDILVNLQSFGLSSLWDAEDLYALYSGNLKNARNHNFEKSGFVFKYDSDI